MTQELEDRKAEVNWDLILYLAVCILGPAVLSFPFLMAILVNKTMDASAKWVAFGMLFIVYCFIVAWLLSVLDYD